MKAGIHPEYTLAQRALLVRQPVLHPLHRGGSARRALLGVPPLLHRQAEAGRHRWPGRALPAPRRQARQGREVSREPRREALREPEAASSERRRPAAHARRRPGRQARRADRRPGGARGRDDARHLDLGGRGAQPRGPGRAQLRAAGAVGEAAPPLAGAGDPRRRRARRVAEDRLPRPGDLRQRPDGGGRGGRQGRDRRLDLGTDHRLLAGARGRPLLRRPGRADQPDQGPARQRPPLLAGRGRSCGRRSSSPTSSRSAACRTCAASSSTTAPSTRRSPATRPKTSWSPRGPSSTRACTRAAAPASC